MKTLNKFGKSLVGTALATILLSAPMLASATQFQVQITGTGAFAGINYNSGIQNTNHIASGTLTSSLGGNFTFDVAVNNALGGAPSFLDDTFGAYNLGSGNGTVTILASATDYTTLTAGSGGTLVGNIGGTTNHASVTAQSWINSSNGLNAMTGDTILQGPFSTSAFSDTSTTGFIAANPFSITQQIILVVSSHGSTTGDFNTAVPEPGTLALLGLGLLAVVALRRRQA